MKKFTMDFDDINSLDDLPADVYKDVMVALIAYAQNGKAVIANPVAKVIFMNIKKNIDKHERISKGQSERISRRWASQDSTNKQEETHTTNESSKDSEYLSDTCDVHEEYVSDTRDIHEEYSSDTCGVHDEYLSDTCGIRDEYLSVTQSQASSGSEAQDSIYNIYNINNIYQEKLEGLQTEESPVVFRLELNDGSKFPVTEQDIAEYEELYPAVDVRQEFRGMIGWIKSNPEKRKTRRGIRRFINGWLSREQDKGGNKPKVIVTKREPESLWGVNENGKQTFMGYERL